MNQPRQNLSDSQKDIIYHMLNKKLNEQLRLMKKKDRNKKIIIGVTISILLLITLASGIILL